MTLYLQYRPLSFADVVGQDHVVTTLENAVAQDRLSHAYLLSGTRGTGKTSVARIIAKTILLRGIDDPVILKHMTKSIEEGNLVDFIEIDAASNRRIDDIRELIEKIGFAPSVSRAKVYIIDEVHMLTKEAFNALLKTLEEPPEYAYFILATTELHKVPDTIQSRCQRFLFKRVKDEDIVRRLQYIVDQEKISIERDALRAIAKHALGSFRDGISLLDQLRTSPKITLEEVTDRIGATSIHYVSDIIEAIQKKDTHAMTIIVGKIEEANIPLDSVIVDILSFLRTEMHTALEEKKDASVFAAMISRLLQTLKNIRHSPLPGLVLETGLLELIGIHEGKEKSLSVLHAPKKVETPMSKEERNEQNIPEEKRPSIISVAEVSKEEILKNWDAIIKNIQPPSVRMSLKNASIQNVEGTKVTFVFESAFHRDKVQDIKASRGVEEVLQGIFKVPIEIQCILETEKRSTNVSPNTDLAEAAAEVFGFNA